MRVDGEIFRWAVFALVLAFFLDVYSHSSVSFLPSVSQGFSLPLPAQVEWRGTISNVHFSGPALVFDFENEGKITCYFRHPPPAFFPFSGDSFVMRARIEQTPNGRLCVVQEMDLHALP